MEPDQEQQPQAHREDFYILIVDDDPGAREILTAMLHLFQWRARGATSGAAALEAVAADPPALILLDLMMPDMTGFEVLKRLKANPRSRAIPVIIISALGDDQRLIRLGASRVIAKGTYSVDKLRQAIDDCLPERLRRHP